MATRRAFISFDYDHDNSLRGDLVAQAERSDSPFSITDCSVKATIDVKWKKEVRERIRSADLMIVIRGEHTHDAAGVAAEVTIAQEEGKRYFLLKGRRGKPCQIPRNSRKDDEMQDWTWPKLKDLIEGNR